MTSQSAAVRPTHTTDTELPPRVVLASMAGVVAAMLMAALDGTIGLVPVLLALSWGGRNYAWSSAPIAGLLSGGGLIVIIFLISQTRVLEPLMPPALFKHRVVWTSSIAATLTSIGMFGTTLFIPLFIQGVVGRSATQSGAVVTPMMLSLIAASMISGHLMSRRGRYKALAVVGVTVTALAMFLLAAMDRSTTYATVLRNVTIMGVGLGMTMPVFSLAVQNAVDLEHVGVATSAIQFLRSIGGSLGAAVFGAALTNRFAPAFHRALPAQVAAGVPPSMLAAFENPQALMNPSFAAQLQAQSPAAAQRMVPILGAVKHALTASLHDVFLIGAIVVTSGIVFTLMLVDIPLRTTNRRPDAAGAEEPPTAMPSFEV